MTVTADVTDFAMNAISLNGVKLRLNLDLDGADLTGMLDRLQSGSVQLDDGATRWQTALPRCRRVLTP